MNRTQVQEAARLYQELENLQGLQKFVEEKSRYHKDFGPFTTNLGIAGESSIHIHGITVDEVKGFLTTCILAREQRLKGLGAIL